MRRKRRRKKRRLRTRKKEERRSQRKINFFLKRERKNSEILYIKIENCAIPGLNLF
jgi:hypothetical protein